MFKASYYNLRVEENEGTLLFNGVTGALLRLPNTLAEALSPYLGEVRRSEAGIGYSAWTPEPFKLADLPRSVKPYAETLVASGMLVASDRDERGSLEKSYLRNRESAPLFVTMTTTLDCNMRCYYCYQKDGVLNGMNDATCDAAMSWVQNLILTGGHRTVHVDWYGGEPMLNQPAIERFSEAMIPWCEERNVRYRGSMICNGTCWPEDAPAFVGRNRIESIQFSLDGPKKHHDKRRGKIRLGGPGRDASFDEVMDTIDRVVGTARIYLRINVDPFIGWDALEVIDEMECRGWLAKERNFYPYLAVINAMTEHCGFIGKAQKFNEFYTVFDEIQREFYARLGAWRGVDTLEILQYYPNRVSINCAAVSKNSVVFGPEGLMYKCGLDVGDVQRAHDAVGSAETTVDRLDPGRWDAYDPFTHPRCGECQYLPVCMGGCPKAQIDKDEAQVALQSAYWEANFSKVIREYAASARGSTA